MNKLLGSLIVVSPSNPRLFKFQFTSRALLILALTCLISFCTVLAISFTFPELVSESEHLQLQNENHELKVQNTNAEIRAERVLDRIERMEEQSKRISELMATE